MRFASALALLALASPGLAEEEARPRFTCGETVSADTLTDATPDGELRLAAAGAARLADVRVAPSEEAAQKAGTWLQSLRHSRVQLRIVSPPDRWGRVATHVELTEGPAPIDVGELLVSEGLAVVDPGQRDVLCRPELLAAEEKARRRRLGLWRAGSWPIAAAATEELERAAGTFAIVQGRVISVGERRERTYLNFGRDWSRDFAVTIARRSWTDLRARGITAETLKGRIVRVRGIVEKRRSPMLDLTVPDMLELVETRTRRSGGE